ncbi:MAG: hypothetical protein M1839_000109 [Geoglossum umbratile]|nr:MAG: hypothetical protein M1839_000109 [Geoglossum umbratile]
MERHLLDVNNIQEDDDESMNNCNNEADKLPIFIIVFWAKLGESFPTSRLVSKEAKNVLKGNIHSGRGWSDLYDERGPMALAFHRDKKTLEDLEEGCDHAYGTGSREHWAASPTLPIRVRSPQFETEILVQSSMMFFSMYKPIPAKHNKSVEER